MKDEIKSTHLNECFLLNRQLPILPGRFQPSTFDVWAQLLCSVVRLAIIPHLRRCFLRA
ncbi:MAG: hypothetical protein H6Q68_2023, partial [Firmicutes bacterium]|nr:hypothetical protein [Bacillota bacterium]